MNIQGLDYNTQREALVLPEYGREIQKMIEHAISLPTKEERLSCAKAIVRMMEHKVPQLRGNGNYKQTLWDHLYLMSHKQLDIDWPYDVSEAEKFNDKPAHMQLPQGNIRLRHYGRLIEKSLQEIKEMPDSPERDMLIQQTANQMKRDLVQWGHGSIDDEKVADDMARLTDGAVQLDLGTFRFERIDMSNDLASTSKKKKKK